MDRDELTLLPAAEAARAIAAGELLTADLVAACLAPIRQLRPVREMATDYPETELTAMDAKWWNLVKYDSAVVSMNDGTSVALYKRDPAHYRDLLRRTVEIHRRFHREWPELAQQYRDALGEITSPEAWEKTFAPWTDAEPVEAAGPAGPADREDA